MITSPRLSAVCLTFGLLAGVAAQAAPAQAPVARGLIVTLKAPVDGGRDTPQSARERLLTVAADTGLPAAQAPTPVGRHAHLLRFGGLLSGAALADAERRMRLNPEVASVEPDVRLYRLSTPTDPGYTDGKQWNLQAPAPGRESAIDMPAAWARTLGGPAHVVALLDTGVLYNHPDLSGKLLPGYDMVSDLTTSNDGDGRDADASDPGDWLLESEVATGAFQGCQAQDSTWHGTFIAGQIAAITNNATGVAGIDWGARIVPVRVAGKCGAWMSDMVDGIRWAAGLPVQNTPINPHPARVINVSFGGPTSCTDAYRAAISDVATLGALVVVAAGNLNGPLTRPADCPGVLAVGAVREDGLKTYYSNFGANIGVMAPGGPGTQDQGLPIYSTSNTGKQGPEENTYLPMSGTSFSSPQAAGVASLMMGINPTLTPSQLVSRIQASARPFPSRSGYPACSVSTPPTQACNCTRETCGPGILDAGRAVELAYSPSVVINPVGLVVPGPVLLDGSGSKAVDEATIVSYGWSQVSGPAAELGPTDGPKLNVTLPTVTSADRVFRLLVTDSKGRSADNFVVLRMRDSAVDTSTNADGSSGGSGGGATGALWGVGLWALALSALRRRRVA